MVTRPTMRQPGVWGRLSLCTAFVLMLLVVPKPAHASTATWTQATATGYGVRLTLSIRRRTYPRNALVRVWTRIQNLTGHTLDIYSPGPMVAGQYVPQVVVLAKRKGTPLPISLTDYLPFSGPADSARPLAPHSVHNTPEVAILRGPLLRLDLTFAVGGPGPPGMGPTLSTPLLRLHLSRPDTPTVMLRVPPDQPSAGITPAGPVRGQPLAVWYYNCRDAYDAAVQEDIHWIGISRHIIPSCPAGSSLIGWNKIVGWLNHSVADVNWGQPYRGSSERVLQLPLARSHAVREGTVTVLEHQY